MFMLVQSAESRQLFDEYHKVFGSIDRQNVEKAKAERRALEIMRELQRMDAISEKIERSGKIDKIANFNRRYVALKIELNKIYRRHYG